MCLPIRLCDVLHMFRDGHSTSWKRQRIQESPNCSKNFEKPLLRDMAICKS